MNQGTSPRTVICNGAAPTTLVPSGESPALTLEYRKNANVTQNVRIHLPDFVRDVYYLPERILDLLEIAAYIYTADRLSSRGAIDLVEYHTWERNFQFAIKVRDYAFWSGPKVQEALSQALTFMTGDSSFSFSFSAGHATPRTSLFDSEKFVTEPSRPSIVSLFSGGLDSLAGIVGHLANTDDTVYLVSHQSGLPSTKKTQNVLFAALNKCYPGRVHHYRFQCGCTK